MTVKPSDPNDIGSVFLSDEAAEQWQSRKAQRGKVNAAADEMLIDAANLRPGNRVLDVAAGTGDQTLLAARRVGPTGYILATDFSAAMLRRALDAAREAGLMNVETRVMDAENIDLDADSFDAVICRQGLMLFSSPVKALTGMRRAVKPDGKVAALVWSTEEKNPYTGLSFAIVRRIANIPAPAPGQPGLFALGEPPILEGVFRAAGFLEIAIHPVSLLRRFASAANAVQAMSNPALNKLVARLSDPEREQAWAEIERALSRYEGPDGLEVPGELLIAVGTK